MNCQALPEHDRRIEAAGWLAHEAHQDEPAESRWLKRHSTHFIRVIVPRAADPKIFTLKRG